ncbi:uncharacterized protein LOC128982670 [Macrosteles quadrilineatus]|uniref:uncharacterized protein LOC128982670 n=1 Tax=Macrosteles quadrilineatus TaxID=74068 RepID=UPI0023E0F432|nr:uncharacterized protein LOC128982670 [Macrosteles quadrilineatus]
MNVYHLRKKEVEYELRIRGLSSDGNANELRKRLQQSVANNDEVSVAAVNSLDVAEELEECESKLEDLSANVADYEGNFTDNEYHRIVARLWHLYLRIGRIPGTAGSDDEQEKTKTELEVKTKELLDTFKDQGTSTKNIGADQPTKIVDETSTTPSTLMRKTEDGSSSVKTQMSLTLPTSNAANNKDGLPQQRPLSPLPQKIDIPNKQPDQRNSVNLSGNTDQEKSSPSNRPKYVPVYKWGLKFDNNAGSSVAAFLERVEELRRARGVTHSELFESAVDLFSGSALVWYRASTSRIHSWPQLCKELRDVFQPPDYDFRLQQEIFNRIQGEQEPIDLYMAAMEGLYERLSVEIPETSRLAQIFNNLHPQLQDRLALLDIKSLDELRLMGRRAQAGRLRTSKPRPSPRSETTLEPDLAYQEPYRHRRVTGERVASIHQSPSGDNFPFTCWNCSMRGHRFRDCTRPKKRFCYGCGKDNILKKDCPSCVSKNGLSRESAT